MMTKTLGSKFGNAVQRFWKEEKGTATVEAVLWMPMFFGAFMLIVDVSMLFNGQTQVLRVVQDANRNFSVGRIATTADLSTYIESRLATMAPNATASSTVSAGSIITNVSIPSSDLIMTGWFDMLGKTTVSVRSEHLVEY